MAASSAARRSRYRSSVDSEVRRSQAKARSRRAGSGVLGGGGVPDGGAVPGPSQKRGVAEACVEVPERGGGPQRERSGGAGVLRGDAERGGGPGSEGSGAAGSCARRSGGAGSWAGCSGGARS